MCNFFFFIDEEELQQMHWEWSKEGAAMKVSVYEVGPRDGLQGLEQPVKTETKIQLINALYNAGLENIEETSFAHPRLVPQMADAEDVFQKGSVLVMNKRGYDRAMAVGAEKINIVFSPVRHLT